MASGKGPGIVMTGGRCYGIGINLVATRRGIAGNFRLRGRPDKYRYRGKGITTEITGLGYPYLSGTAASPLNNYKGIGVHTEYRPSGY